MAARCKEPCLLSQKQIKNKNNPLDSQGRLETRLVKELRQQPMFQFCAESQQEPLPRGCWRGNGNNAEKNKKILPCRSLRSLFGRRDVQGCLKQGRRQTGSVSSSRTKTRESSSECTACMFVAVPHLKGSPR